MSKSKNFDLYTFVAAGVIQRGEPFQITCNCGGVITIMPPFEEESFICPSCEASIKIIGLEGDPGYVVGRDPAGKTMLIPVQGSSARPVHSMTPEERDGIIKNIELNIGKKEEGYGGSD